MALPSTSWNDAFNDEANTATVMTSPRPIISAAAVDAVRCGLRIAFCRARAPTVPPRRGSGAPMTRAIGRAIRGLSAVTPRNVASTPRPRTRIPEPP
ncbi:MAG: hypothetical protein ACXVXG_17950 [Nocardioidaceae bacterium]